MACRQKIGLFCTALALSLLCGCSSIASEASNYTWGWHILNPLQDKGASNLRFLTSGLVDTVLVSVCAIALSVCVGLLVAVAGLSKRPGLKLMSRVYVEVFRAIPLLVLLLWVFYGLPVIIGLQLGVFVTGVLAMALSDSAFEAEIFRAGIESVPSGQIEAAKALGLPWALQMRLVVIPQAVKVILPALGNQFVYVLKMSSLISVIGLSELTRKANELNVNEYRPLEIYTLLVVEYLALILLVSYGVRQLERKLSTPH
ncbi:amino acid ABC transporter permease [Rhodoferax sp.]|uniref:amino acid ABC transporter permease n=1 Tax=Rhodoferax sp. TaxID=50421 RepID=UPI00263315BC|nr:amino acid ABC transporter permease [Rhodoferax sp.]MDD2809948.1 amino acid ABC transporter permease [Rhodoferax sp.]MDD4943577.1 amino acid ABC transporter permease [Rhodoferax sp.]